jgi:plasmid replication initiation protein
MKSQYDKSLYIVSSNDLINAKYSYTLWEKRVFLYMISQLKRDDTTFPHMRIPVKELMNFFGATGKSEYQLIRSIPENIIRKPFYIPYAGANGEKRWMLFSVISAGTQPDASEQREESYIELQFNPVLIPHLLELKEKFTKYNIRNISELQSVYSIRIFEFIKEHEFRKDGVEVSIDTLKEMLYMKASDNEGSEIYPLYADFKKRVLMKAQEDLTKFCDTTFEFDEIKEGRRVAAIYFRPIKNKNYNTTPPSVVEPIIVADKAIITANAALFAQAQSLNIGSEIVQLLLDTQAEADVKNGLDYTQDAHKQGKIRDNIVGFFINAVKNKYTSVSFEKIQKQAQQKAAKADNEAKKKALKQQIDDLTDLYFKKVMEVIRHITQEDDTITLRAIEVVKAQNPTFLKSKKANLDDFDLEDFRKDKVLRELVIEQIQLQNPQFFQHLQADYGEPLIVLKNTLKNLQAV